MTSDAKLVYSTDPELNKRCTRCGQLQSACRCASEDEHIDISTIRAVLRLEKAHRGGKDVTVIDRLPGSESFLKVLAQDLKKRCGSGGTFRIKEGTGTIEIQGDKRDNVRKELSKTGIKCK